MSLNWAFVAGKSLIIKKQTHFPPFFNEKKKISCHKKKSSLNLIVPNGSDVFCISDGMFAMKKKKRKEKELNHDKKKKKDDYSPLHTHSDLSLLDGASQISELVRQAKSLNLNSLSITDHGVMNGIIDLIKDCESLGIKPIAGNEMYVINGNISRNYRRSEISKYHQIVLALTKKGYQNLVKLTTLSHLIGWQGKGAFGRPCINKKMLNKYQKDIVLTSACLGGELSQNLLNDFFLTARDIAEWYRDHFQKSFFLEIQDHGHREDRAVNMKVLKISRELKINLLATNDSHFTEKKDVETHDTLLCVQTGKAKEELNRMRYSGTEFLKSANEMFEMFIDHIPPDLSFSALDNSKNIGDGVEDYSVWSEVKIPKFEMPNGYEDFAFDDFLRALTYEGFYFRLTENFTNAFELEKKKDFMENSKKTFSDYEKYYQRLNFELDVICSMGFSTYFLVVWDYINFARKSIIPVGPGRGSAAGSLVAYALGITNIDPIEHGLIFERFLNPSRNSMPDIDTDFSIDGREMVIEYVSMRYGHENVAQIATFNKLSSKAILKDMGKSGQVSASLLEKLSGMIPITRGKPASLNLMIVEDSPSMEFRQNYLMNSILKSVIDKSIKFEGMVKTTAVHAAGIVISSVKLDGIVPLCRGQKGEIVTQYPMENIELLGLLKMDFLGLKNLSMIETVVNLVNHKYRNSILTIDSDCLKPHFDLPTYGLLARGDLEGIFQFDASYGMKDVVSEIRPNSIQDISSILALYRPGPLDAGLIPKFVTGKREEFAAIEFFPELHPILSETYGILLYQEQIMKLAQEIGGYSMDQADLLRRAIGKKKLREMQRQKKNFLEGCLNNSLEKDTVFSLFYQVVGFAEYCFNKSHSAAYAFTTYQTAWLKSHWPVEFFASLLSANLGDTDKIEKFIFQAASFGVMVCRPCLNNSDVFFFPTNFKEKISCLSFGLGSVNNVGEAVAIVIAIDRKVKGVFVSLSDIVERLIFDQLLGKKIIQTLILSGSLDEIGNTRNRIKLLWNLEQIIKWFTRKEKYRSRLQPSLLDLGWVAGGVSQIQQEILIQSWENGKKETTINENELSIIQKSLTGISSGAYLLIEEIKSILILGSLFSPSFLPVDSQLLEKIKWFQNYSEKKKSEISLGIREYQKIGEFYEGIKQIWLVGIIVEIQNFRLSGNRVMLKFFIQDITGLRIAFKFIDFANISTKKQIEIQKKFFSSPEKKSEMIGKRIYCYGFFQEDTSQGTFKFIIQDLLPLSLGKVVIITLNPETSDSYSIQSLIKFSLSRRFWTERDVSFLIPILINIEGGERSEIIRTKFLTSKKLANLDIEKLKRLGFRCGLYNLKREY